MMAVTELWTVLEGLAETVYRLHAVREFNTGIVQNMSYPKRPMPVTVYVWWVHSP